MVTSTRTSCMLSAGLAFFLTACEEHPEIEIDLVRENGRKVRLDATMRERFQLSEPRRSPEESIAERIQWKLPEGWEQLPRRPLRIVNLRAGEAECYVTYLTGGSVAGNVNRWRSEMGLPAASASEIAAMKQGELFEREAHRVDLRGTWSGRGGPKEGYRLVATYAQFPQFAMSVKMLGPEAAVDAAVAGFDEFCASLSFKGGFGKTAAREPGGAAHGGGDRGDLKWDVPEGWTKSQGHAMRHVTYSTGGSTSCWVTFLGPAAGSWGDNVNRWLGEIGEPALSADALAGLPHVELLGKQVPILESYGKTTGVLGVMAVLPNANMFVKLTGPGDEVKAQRAKFEEFCKSLRFEQ